MSCIFFYGLFMDEALLEGMGLHPELIGLAKLSNFKIAIGNKATLIPNPGSSCYGVVVELTDEEASALYSNPEVSEYEPELVNAVFLHNGSIQPSSCHILPSGKFAPGINIEYAEKLSTLVRKLGFPEAYAREIMHR